MTKEQRHHCMASIHGRDTKPEMMVRKFLFGRGFRYRLNHPRLPGHPDIVLRKYRSVIFVNGCFWHGHQGCFILPKSNTDFWKNKIERNINRDRENIIRLESLGWRVIVVWECEIRKKERRKERLDEIYLEIVSGKAE